MKEAQIIEMKEIALEIENYMSSYPALFREEVGESAILVAKLIGYIKAL